MEFFNATPFGPEAEAIQRADILAALNALLNVSGYKDAETNPQILLARWGFRSGQPEEVPSTDETAAAVCAMFGGMGRAT